MTLEGFYLFSNWVFRRNTISVNNNISGFFLYGQNFEDLAKEYRDIEGEFFRDVTIYTIFSIVDI